MFEGLLASVTEFLLRMNRPLSKVSKAVSRVLTSETSRLYEQTDEQRSPN